MHAYSQRTLKIFKVFTGRCNVTNSVTSEKLQILTDLAAKLPPEAFSNLQSVTVTWTMIGGVVVPDVAVVYKD